jgi:hypothetical protein
MYRIWTGLNSHINKECKNSNYLELGFCTYKVLFRAVRHFRVGFHPRIFQVSGNEDHFLFMHSCS